MYSKGICSIESALANERPKVLTVSQCMFMPSQLIGGIKCGDGCQFGECPALSSEKCEAGDEYLDNISKLERVAARAKEFVSKAAKCVTVVTGQGTVNEQGEVEEISSE